MKNTTILRRCAIIVASVIISAHMIASPVSANGFTNPRMLTEPGMVKDIDPSGDSSPEYFTAMGSTLFFSAYNATTGRELWKSDGTEAGTVMVKDICPGDGSSFPSYLTVMGSTLFFTANDGTNGDELWKSDGTEAGTAMVKDINPSGGSVGGSWPDSLTVMGNTLFFEADDGTSGYELWKSDGTDAGTALVKDINPGSNPSYPYYLTVMGSTLFFQACDDGTYGCELWESDGTVDGTVMVKDINPGSNSSYPYYFTAMGSILFFGADDGTNGNELWMSDGTEAGTVMVKAINPVAPGSSPGPFTVMGNTLFFSAFNTTTGRELWKSDGTEAGTVIVKDIYPGSEGSSVFEELVVMDDALFFQANDGTNGAELWRSDGTEAGTVMVKNINPSGYSSPYWLAAMGGALFFQADDGTDGSELWKTDGTEAGTMMVEDIDPGSGGSYPLYLTVMGGTLFFSANDGAHGYELWKLEALPTDSIVNGSFETGDYTGWILLEDSGYADSGTWGIAQDGDVINYEDLTYDFCDGFWVQQSSPGLPITYNATDGNYVAYQLPNGPENHRMYQDITLSPSAENLTWDMWYTNHEEYFYPDSQYLAVNIRDPLDDSIIEPLFKTTEGVDPESIPMTHFSRDISAYAGMTVRLDIEMSVQEWYFDAAFDNFAIEGAITGDKLFMVDAYNSTIYDLDPSTGAVLNTIPTPVTADECDGLAYGNGRMFFVSCNATIYEIDPSDGGMINQFTAAGTVWIDALGFSGDKLYALEYGESPAIHVLDPDTGANITTLQLPVPLVGGLTFAGTRCSLFVTDANNSTIYEIDAETGAVLNSFSAIVGSGEGLLGLGFSSSRNTLFLGFEENNMIYEVDPDDGNVINCFGGPEGAGISALAADECGVAPSAPEADFYASSTQPCVGAQIEFADNSTGTYDNWYWDFGDGSNSTDQNPSHTYATAGNYTVSLTISDGYGDDTEIKVDYITVSPQPVANFYATATDTCANATTNFFDYSSGTYDSWYWDFGDGSNSTAQNATHAYASAGNYTVSLTVSSCCCNDTETKSDYITVWPRPEAAFHASNTTICANVAINFTDDSTGIYGSWFWDFGDGSYSADPNPSHTYTSAGNYTVILDVYNDWCEDAEIKIDYITVLPLPEADFHASDTSPYANVTINFLDDSSGTYDSWFWDFGDGSNSTLQNPSHNYTSVGNYTVSLTISNGCGYDTETKDDYIQVTSAYSVVIDIKPGVSPNDINLRSKGKLVPVAILTTPGFNASTVAPSTVEFAGAAPVKWQMVDVPEDLDSWGRKYIGDGDIDLLLYFKTGELQLTSASTEATLTGETLGGVPIAGTDSVNIVRG